MGLRLYQAPVESDIQSKSAADKSSAEARSSIRRSRLPTSELRQQRRRRLAVTAAINSGNAAAAGGSRHYDNLRRRSHPAERSSGSSSDSSNNADSNRDTARDGTGSIAGMLDDQVVALFGRRLAHLHSMSQYPGALTDDEDSRPDSHLTAEAPLAHMAVEPGFLSRRPPQPPPQALEFFTAYQHGRAAPPYPSRERAALRRIRDRVTGRTADRASLGLWGYPYPRPEPVSGRRRGEQESSVETPQVDGLGDRHRSLSSEDEQAWEFFPYPRPEPLSRGRRDEQAPPVETPQVDGLGDRNRSLSPEGDHVWDIFTTTVTPDPRTPSAGSSFASAAASAVASQNNAAAPSVGTTVTVPDAPVEPSAEAVEPPCETEGEENSDTEDTEDNEDGADLNPLTRFPPSLNRIRRSYADVTRSNDSSDDSLEILGGMGGLQRIVRNLATREDVPDEWWAEAGLSRMLSRGASGN